MTRQDQEMLDEYDFSRGIRGKYAQRYRQGTNLVKLDEDLRKYFPDDKAVNDALRSLVTILHQHVKITLSRP